MVETSACPVSCAVFGPIWSTCRLNTHWTLDWLMVMTSQAGWTSRPSEAGGLFDAVEGHSAGRRGQRGGTHRPAPEGVPVLPANPALPDSRAHLHTRMYTHKKGRVESELEPVGTSEG